VRLPFFLSVFTVVYVITLGFAQAADVRRLEPVAVSTGVAVWNGEFESRTTAMRSAGTSVTDYTECRETREIRGAYLCLSFNQVSMNLALGRASFFIEGLGDIARGTVVSQRDPQFRRYQRMIGGHDLKAADLKRFHEAVTEKCRTDADYCPNAQETALFDSFILPIAAQQPDMVVITYALESSMRYDEVVTHEILHAQYFLDAAFRQVVDTYWATSVPAAEKEAIKSALSEHYDRTDDLLMKNEFQAYMLMAGADMNLLSRYVGRHREPLMAALRAVSVTPIQVQ